MLRAYPRVDGYRSVDRYILSVCFAFILMPAVMLVAMVIASGIPRGWSTGFSVLWDIQTTYLGLLFLQSVAFPMWMPMVLFAMTFGPFLWIYLVDRMIEKAWRPRLILLLATTCVGIASLAVQMAVLIWFDFTAKFIVDFYLVMGPLSVLSSVISKQILYGGLRLE